MDPKQLPEFEVLEPYKKKVFGELRTTNIFPIGAPTVDTEGNMCHSIKADVTGKSNAELLCLGVDALKLLHSLTEDQKIANYIGRNNIRKNVEIHRLMNRLAEI